jgi:GNAT superfamily N-acetyltransferase
LAVDDLDQAVGLSTAAGWNQPLDDWRLFLRIAPAGAFAAAADGRIVGTAIGVDYGGFAWIAMMLVDPAFRGCGLGGRLLEAALESLPANLPVRLDATPLGRPLYRRYGFELETTLSRFVVNRAFTPKPDAHAVRPLTIADLPLAIERDREIFGGVRAAVLDWSFCSASCYAHVAPSADGAIQYCFGRRGRLFDQIGPVVAGGAAVAHALVHTACAAANGRPIAVDAFDLQSAFTAGLRERGFVVERPFFRMRLPRRPVRRSPQGEGGSSEETEAGLSRGVAERATPAGVVEYAIFGPEFG